MSLGVPRPLPPLTWTGAALDMHMPDYDEDRIACFIKVDRLPSHYLPRGDRLPSDYAALCRPATF